jgi:hypothetical protein
MEEDIINDIKKVAITTIKSKIEAGDIATIRYYLDHIDIIGDDSLVKKALDSLKFKISNGDVSAIAVFYDYFSS